ncbi:hypothetical protein [Plantibacter sp. YIM 135347]|uniref:hypothetical protein n=1 Tax=Plantibacter sp. YIM 135347 TaxID=3423919 RepID=UPI003D33F737
MTVAAHPSRDRYADAARRTALHRWRAALAAAILTIGMIAVGPAPAAQAMVQIGSASGYPGDSVQVKVQNTVAGAPNSAWTVTAPPGTTVTAASGASASGTSPFGCSLTATGASCGPSNAAGWAAGNIVTMTLAIAPNRAAGLVTGFSFTPVDEGSFRVTVLPPPAPTIASPVEGSRSLDDAPVITGDKRSGNAASVSIDGAPACSIPADASTTWSCQSPVLAPGQHAATAIQTSPAGDASPVSATRTFDVLEPAALALAQTGPTIAVPTVPIERTITVTNNGPGTAVAADVSIDLGDFPATTCRIDGTSQDCSTLSAGVALGDLASGRQVPIVIDGVVPAGTAAGTSYTLGAILQSLSDAASPVTSTETITVSAPEAPRIASPANGSQTTSTAPGVSGDGAIAGATVSVTGPAGLVCTATASISGAWSCTPASTFALGAVPLRATQSIGGLTSPAATSVFTVVAVPVTPPAPPAPAPAPSRPAPRPTTPPSPPATPAPAPIPAPVQPPRPAPTATPKTAALPMDFTFAASRIDPGTVGVMRGTLGANASAQTVDVTLTGRVGSGMIYRSVALRDGGSCTVLTTTFSCTITLAPGQSAELELRLYADALNAPDTARQQLVATSSLAAQSNAMTSTITVGGTNESAALAASFSTFPITTFPGAFGPLLALLLLALAATETEKQRRRRAAAATRPSPTAPEPPRSEP